jgi:hypothetical protein
VDFSNYSIFLPKFNLYDVKSVILFMNLSLNRALFRHYLDHNFTASTSIDGGFD